MSEDDNHDKPKYEWKLGTYRFSKMNLSDLPDGFNAEEAKMRHAIAKAMQIAIDDVFANGDSSHKIRYEPRPPTLTFNNLPCVIETPEQRFRRKMRAAILGTLKQAGLHPENVERVQIALDSDKGKDAIDRLTWTDIRDVEQLAQIFLAIYRDINK